MPHEERYDSVRTLQSNGIPCVVWLEDAVHHYGVPTDLFDLYILVDDIRAAAAVLARKGWQHADGTRRIARYPVDSPQRRLRWAEMDMTVVLLPVSEWKYNLERNPAVDSRYPPLPALLDSIIDTMLEGPEDLRRPVAIYGSYLYLYSPELKDPSFADKLQPENRQFHHDCIAGMVFGTLAFYEHQRRVRDELRAGTRHLQQTSAPLDSELFRLKAPPPPARRRLTSDSASDSDSESTSESPSESASESSDESVSEESESM